MEEADLDWILDQIGPAPEYNPEADDQERQVERWQVWSIERHLVAKLRVALGIDQSEPIPGD